MENPFPGVLVELIVVLVILAILAAMMVPALLGWIDEARNKQYVLEARNIYMAAQSVADKAYGTGAKEENDKLSDLLTRNISEIAKLSDMTEVEITEVTSNSGSDAALEPGEKDTYVIKTMTVKFKSSDGTKRTAVLGDGEWKIESETEAGGGEG